MEKPRLPRTAKKIQTKKMEAELEQIGLEIEPDEDVSLYVCSLVLCKLFSQRSNNSKVSGGVHSGAKHMRHW